MTNKIVGNMEQELNGHNLVHFLIEQTGLPKEMIQKELFRLIKKYGKSSHELTVDEVREILFMYMKEHFLNILLMPDKTEKSSFKSY